MNKEFFLKLCEDVDAIIFDFGGIFIDIDYKLTISEFEKISKNVNVAELYSKNQQIDLFSDFEMGKISSELFIKKLKEILLIDADDQIIIKAWNSMLLDIKIPRINLLKHISKQKRVFLLSNINQIHENYIKDFLAKRPALADFYKIFERVYFSHHLSLRKPQNDIFELVIKENNLNPTRTLFIDDSIQHIKSASEIGLKTHLLDPPNTFICY